MCWCAVQVPDKVLSAGVISLSSLQNSFGDVERACRRAAYLPHPSRGDIIALSYARVMSWFTFPERSLVAGDDDHARLTRANYYVNRGELGAAVRELEQLKSPAVQAASRRWLNEAQHRLTVTLALDGMCLVLRCSSPAFLADARVRRFRFRQPSTPIWTLSRLPSPTNSRSERFFYF
jgi:hypothetical protein